jgi:3-dehydroquinate synthase
MEQDKKMTGGGMTLILLRGIGDAFVARDVPREKVRVFLKEQLG